MVLLLDLVVLGMESIASAENADCVLSECKEPEGATIDVVNGKNGVLLNRHNLDMTISILVRVQAHQVR